MAMRVCIYCKQDVTYERENRNMLANGVVGFWTNPLNGQASCPAAPVSANGQQLHDVGDVHTPPVHDPAELEKFLDGTYVPPVPGVPCGDFYGMSDEGDFLQCGLDKAHDGPCAPGTAVDLPTPGEVPTQAEPPPDDGVQVIDFDVDQQGDVITVTMGISGCELKLSFDGTKVGPHDVVQMLNMFPAEARKVVLSVMTGLDPTLIEQAEQAEVEAARPEVPKLLEDPSDIEKFLNDDE